MTSLTHLFPAARQLARRAAALAMAGAALGCNTVLDVDNPNNVPVEALDVPTTAAALATGAAASMTRALTALYAPYGATTDEFAWVGSREGYKISDDGNVGDPSNEFVDAAWPFIAEARYHTDDAVTRLEAFRASNALPVATDLARAYLYKAVTYVTIADMFDDFVTASDRRENAAPVGEAQMVTLYDQAIAALDKGLLITTSASTLRTNLLAMRARAKFAKAAWQKVNPIGSVNTASPLVNDAGADADARDALLAMSGDYRYQVTPAVGGNNGFPIVGNDLNNRLELRAGDYSRDLTLCTSATCDRYVLPTAAGNRVTGTKYVDPITNAVDPVLAAAVNLCCIRGAQNNNGDFVPLTVISAREMHLIRAEVALAQGRTADFTTHINNLRAMNSLTPWAGTPTARAILEHSRFVNLYNQGRRLTDMYRFNLPSARWAANGDVNRKPGCFFPIPAIEKTSNEKAATAQACRN